jgi:hypothetical protein
MKLCAVHQLGSIHGPEDSPGNVRPCLVLCPHAYHHCPNIPYVPFQHLGLWHTYASALLTLPWSYLHPAGTAYFFSFLMRRGPTDTISQMVAIWGEECCDLFLTLPCQEQVDEWHITLSLSVTSDPQQHHQPPQQTHSID